MHLLRTTIYYRSWYWVWSFRFGVPFESPRHTTGSLNSQSWMIPRHSLRHDFFPLAIRFEVLFHCHHWLRIKGRSNAPQSDTRRQRGEHCVRLLVSLVPTRQAREILVSWQVSEEMKQAFRFPLFAPFFLLHFKATRWIGFSTVVIIVVVDWDLFFPLWIELLPSYSFTYNPYNFNRLTLAARATKIQNNNIPSRRND